ncbi:golgin-84 isoform X2 [Aethina tumida]|uniref:golgin-84 isoform X2 n=1 Tax=Aethina tumida TaxID=116153 RepID=UPI002148FD20|nr:golgin-84 isoform X2 [Aethina tumida]
MAWLQNLAGKAEDLLNKVDQNAATVLNKSTSKSTEKLNLLTSSSSSDLFKEDEIRASSSHTSLNTYNRTPVKRQSPVSDVPKDTDLVDTGITFTVTSEKKKDTASEEAISDKLLRSDKSVSSNSSIHHSFLLAEEAQNLHQKIAKLELENQDLNKQLLNLQHLYSGLRNDNSNLQTQIERTNEQLSFAQQEKEQYIARAQRILQEKENLIALKQENASPEENENIFANYNDQLKEELKFQQEKNNELLEKNQRLTSDIQSLQMQHQVILNGLQQSNQALEDSLLNEKKFRKSAEEDCIIKTREIQAKHQELTQLEMQLKEHENEIAKLQLALKQKKMVNVNEDLESQVQSLTQTLMMKQNNLETVTTERNALRLQAEKLEMLQKEHLQKIAQLQKSQVKIINVQDANEEIRYQSL